MDLKSLYKQMLNIRYFEERLLKLFDEGAVYGTTHTYVGQEANAVSIISQLKDDDVIFSNHRCHGHYLARFDDPEGLLAELMGKEKGVCGGRGGSQHLYRKNFYTSGVQGGFSPIAAGIGFAEKAKGTKNISVAFIGDGTLGQGVVYETLNLSSLLRIPLLIVVENNFYAQTTPISQNLAGSIIARAKAFDVAAGEISSTDVNELYPHFSKIISKVRNEQVPHMEVINTYRFRAHSKGDDYRPKDEIAAFLKNDPLILAARNLQNAECENLKSEVAGRLNSIEQMVRNSADAQLQGVEL